MLAIIAFISGAQLTGFETHTWWYLAALGLVPQVLGWLAINQALGHIKPTVASVGLLSQTALLPFFRCLCLAKYLLLPKLQVAQLFWPEFILLDENGKRVQWLIKQAVDNA